MNRIQKRDGFQGQIQFVIPRPVLASVAQHILVSGLYPTDIGWYPRALHHYRRRESGAAQHILIICLNGQGWFEISGRRKTIKRGQALLIPKDQPHAYGASLRDPWTIQWLHFAGEDTPCYLTRLRGEFTLAIQPELVSKLDQLFASAYEILGNGFSQQSIICAAQVVRHILGLLLFGNKAFSPNTKTSRSRNLDPVIEFMKKHVDAALTIKDMAEQASLSATHFSRLFSQQTGLPPMEYFIHMKIHRACRFLALTHLPIKEISSRLGYADQYYFSRVFHKVMGNSPKAYRHIRAG
jgi:AraC-like DNA-binding protein